MIFHDVEQNEESGWFDLRIGKITGSGIARIMANEGKPFGDPAKNYAIKIALERITGKSKSDNYSNKQMDRGHEEEPLARMEYESEFFCDVTNGGFFDCGKQGCSPDGLVSSTGVIEIKSHIYSIFYKVKKRGSFEPTYKWQNFFNLKTTGREWIDFISFCLEYPTGKKMLVNRTYAEDCKDVFQAMDHRIEQFEELIEESTRNILKG